MGRLKIFLYGVLILFLCNVCSDENSNEPEKEKDDFPEFEINFIEVDTPQKIYESSQEGNMPAIIAMTTIDAIQMVATFGSDEFFSTALTGEISEKKYLEKPSGKDEIFNRSFTMSGVTINVFQEKTPLFIMGEVTMNGVLEGTSFEFDNWLQSELLTSLGTYHGSFVVYQTNSTAEAMSIEWTQNEPDYVEITIFVNSAGPLTSMTGDWLYQISTNSLVGSMDFLDFHYDIKINGDGTGEYTEWYDGNIITEGDWF